MKKLSKLLSIVGGIFVILVIIAIASPSTPKQNTGTDGQANVTQEPAIKITAKELYQKYENNEVAADEQYKDKQLEISGVISSIGKDLFDSPFVAFKTSNIIGVVQCMLDDSSKSKASTLSKGGSVTMVGKNNGKTLTNVILRECVIK